MATKSFSFLRRLFAHRRENLTLLFLLALTVSACDTLSTRSEIDKQRGRPGATPPGATRPMPRPAPGAPPVTMTEPPQSVAIPAPTPEPTPPPSRPTFLNKELPKVGLILGPGGMKAYAHIGVLREFAKARIPVHAIVGLEWGAVFGGLYAQHGQVNDVEWKAFKLREQDLPGEGGFLSSRIKPESVASLSEFFDTVFAGAVIESSKIDYACPAYWSREDRFGWMTRGPLKVAMRACLPYPPFFTDNAGVYASPFSVDEAATHLRARGANLLVLVNVLGSGEFLPSKLAQGEQAVENLLWSEIRREMLRAKPPGVHFIVNVNTNGHPVTDYAGRRAMVEKGARAAGDVVGKIVSEYGF